MRRGQHHIGRIAHSIGSAVVRSGRSGPRHCGSADASISPLNDVCGRHPGDGGSLGVCHCHIERHGVCVATCIRHGIRHRGHTNVKRCTAGDVGGQRVGAVVRDGRVCPCHDSRAVVGVIGGADVCHLSNGWSLIVLYRDRGRGCALIAVDVCDGQSHGVVAQVGAVEVGLTEINRRDVAVVRRAVVYSGRGGAGCS